MIGVGSVGSGGSDTSSSGWVSQSCSTGGTGARTTGTGSEGAAGSGVGSTTGSTTGSTASGSSCLRLPRLISFFQIDVLPASSKSSTTSSSGLRRNEISFFQIDVGFSSDILSSPPA